MPKSVQPEAGTASVNGTQLYYETLGEGQPLVLIHGGYMDRRMWDDQFYTFAQHYRVIRYDVRGFGKSELPPMPYADRQDLFELPNYLGIEKTYLLGLSLGGVIAIDFTLDYPDMVDALILVGSPVPGFPIELLYTQEQLEQQRSRWAAFEAAIQERNLPAMVDALMEDPTLVPSLNYPEARQRVHNNLSEYSPVADALSYCDLTTGPTGQHISFEERLTDIFQRYDENDIVHIATRLAIPSLTRLVERTQAMLSKYEQQSTLSG